ncbi:MAG TPA: DUF433 domain-containing protein [Longimicrobium sp.]|jgi:uncharacterized protein (DUF433 family)
MSKGITAASPVHSDPEICGGEPVFIGTRVPVKALVDYLLTGHTFDEFLAHFPTVKRGQAEGFLRQATEAFLGRFAGEHAAVDRRPLALPDGSVVHSDPEILGGTPVFVGTRVPVQILIDHIGDGVSVDEFLEDYPSVRRSQVMRFLQG